MRPLTVLAALVVLVCSGCATGVTGEPSTVSDKSALVSGGVITDAGGEVEWWFEFGPTRTYGSETAHGTVATQQNVPAEVFGNLTGLTRDTRYHYRLCVEDSQQQGGPGCGEDRVVRTQSFACGETVTADVRLTGDVRCLNVTQPGLVVGADGLDINLAGFSMGGGITTGGGSHGAIENTGGFDDVTIRNGGMGAFGLGVVLEDASRNRLLRLSTGGGIVIAGGEDSEVRHSFLGSRGAGVAVTDSPGFVLADSDARGSFGSGVFLEVDGARIVRNQIRGGQASICCQTSGIMLLGSGNRVADNTVSGSNGAGIYLRGGADNLILDNDVFGGVIVPNETGDFRGDGIFVSAFSAGTLLRGNSVHDGEDDGIEVQAPATRIGDNSATDNGDFGIDAVSGVTDLGGNSASGNGNPLQCRNVFCQ